MENLLNIRDLSIGYHSPIQSNLNLKLNKGELICLIGPNGVGKSTLLKTLGRIEPVLSGKMELDGKNISTLSPNEISQNIGLVLTDPLNDFNLKAKDVIQMGRYPYTGFWGQLTEEDHQIVMNMVQQVGVENLADRYYAELSDGEKQKIMITKALVQETPLMLLDEPTAFLDFPSKASLLVKLKELARSNDLGVILSTHDIELALKTADQIWLFPQHNQFFSGIPEDLALNGHISRIFNNDRMQFNEASGNFDRSFKAKNTICLKGESPQIFWLEKALHRHSIENKEDASIKITYQDKFQAFKNKQHLFHAQTIEECINNLFNHLA